MRKIFAFASLMILGSVVGCQHTDSGCSSCGCGNSSWNTTGAHHPCTVGVCDCEVPPLAPYGRGLGIPPAQAQTAAAPRIMPQAANDAQGN